MMDRVCTIEELERIVQRGPVIGPLHPLQALCLPPRTEVLQSAEPLREELDDLRSHAVRPIWITEDDRRFADRFLRADASTPPPLDEVNRRLPSRLEYVRSHWLTHRTVANRIVQDAKRQHYKTVILLLVDGLSYTDVGDWSETVVPCFIDGPSITYYQSRKDRSIVRQVGFPGIVGEPRLARRLLDVGIPHSVGFSYWTRASNKVSAYLFEGVPLTRVISFTEAMTALNSIDLRNTYVQIVREGLDGLAHHRREITSEEVQQAVQSIRADVEALLEVLEGGPRPAALYLTADHGILWKAEHHFTALETTDHGHPRYSTEPPTDSEHATAFEFDEHAFYVYHWPYLGASIRSNDCGIHGGLSIQESVVPFIQWELL